MREKRLNQRKSLREKLKECTAEKKKLTKKVKYIQDVANYRVGHSRKQITKYKREYKWLENAVANIVKDESWDKNSSKQLHLEIIIRTIISYHKLVETGIVAFTEFAILLTGSQLEVFSEKDLESRYGKIHFIKRDLKLMQEAKYIDRMYRKQMYFITHEGKLRLNAILGHIYREKGTGYPIRHELKDEI